MGLKVDKSLAMGAARTMLRNAARDVDHRIEAQIERKKFLSKVESESTLERFFGAISGVYGDRMALSRLEYAGKHSSGMIFGFDSISAPGVADEVIGFVVHSERGQVDQNYLRLRMMPHALQRFQQRAAGLIQSFKPVVDEMAPALITYLAIESETEEGDVSGVELLPTRNGALMTRWEADEEMLSGLTWLRTEDLYPNQREVRRDYLARSVTYLSRISVPARHGRFAGRKDRVVLSSTPEFLKLLDLTHPQLFRDGLVRPGPIAEPACSRRISPG